ncbi:MAG: hypothetical protein Q8O42_06865 [Acidobacteriota bacterium]|nr:hypothetical protein [Acidobacteriota bacterium]
MRRLMLLAIGLSALLWTVSARPSPVEPAGVGNVASGFPVHRSLGEGGSRTSAEADPDGPSQADLKWRAQLHTIGVVTESIWTSALVHVELGATRAPRAVDTTLASSSSDPPLSSVPHYLRHTPLLI